MTQQDSSFASAFKSCVICVTSRVRFSPSLSPTMAQLQVVDDQHGQPRLFLTLRALRRNIARRRALLIGTAAPRRCASAAWYLSWSSAVIPSPVSRLAAGSADERHRAIDQLRVLHLLRAHQRGVS